MRLYLLRHGEVHSNHRKYLYGQLDVELSERGKLQSRLAGEYLKNLPLKAVYTSDLQRAHFLGKEIAQHHGLELRQDARLRERHFGDWQGKPWEQIEIEYPELVQKYTEDRFATRISPDAENFLDMNDRVLPCLNEICSRHPEETIAITAHSGTTRVVIAEAMNMPLQSIFTFEQDYCCMNIIDYYPTGRVRLKTLNFTTHIEGLLE